MVPTPGIEPAGSGLPQVLTVAVDVRLACIIMHAFTCSSFQGMFSLPRLTTPRYSESGRSLGSKHNSFRIFSNRISDLGWKNHRENRTLLENFFFLENSRIFFLAAFLSLDGKLMSLGCLFSVKNCLEQKAISSKELSRAE